MADDKLIAKIKEFILEQNNIQTENLKTHINNQITEVKQIIKGEAERTSALEGKLEAATEKIKFLEKRLRKNNIIIFNLDYTVGDLLEYTRTQLNTLLNLKLVESDISNIYQIGKSATNKPIIVEFVAYLKKQLVFKNCKLLKNTNIRISEVLTAEEIEERKVLVRHMKEARVKNLEAYIYANKLYVSGKPYAIQDLDNIIFGGSEGETQVEQEKTANTVKIQADKRKPKAGRSSSRVK